MGGVRWSLKKWQKLGGNCPLLGDRQELEKTGWNLRLACGGAEKLLLAYRRLSECQAKNTEYDR